MQQTKLGQGPFAKAKERVQCVLEGGAHCTREDPACQKHSPIAGLHASWVTPRILAMSRPWHAMLQNGALRELQQLHFGLVVNLQERGEHAHCGPGLVSGTGFTYNPEDLMGAGIAYCNMPWMDMGVPRLTTMTRIVQVMHHCLEERKQRVAVHCHAGLGRTGLAIACLLVFMQSHSPAEAVAVVRQGRPGALQTQRQVLFVYVFERWLQHLHCLVPHEHQLKRLRRPEQPLWNSRYQMRRALPLAAVLSFRPEPPATVAELVGRQRMRAHGASLPCCGHVPKLMMALLELVMHRMMHHAKEANEPDVVKQCRAFFAWIAGTRPLRLVTTPPAPLKPRHSSPTLEDAHQHAYISQETGRAGLSGGRLQTAEALAAAMVEAAQLMQSRCNERGPSPQAARENCVVTQTSSSSKSGVLHHAAVTSRAGPNATAFDTNVRDMHGSLHGLLLQASAEGDVGCMQGMSDVGLLALMLAFVTMKHMATWVPPSMLGLQRNALCPKESPGSVSKWLVKLAPLQYGRNLHAVHN